MLTEREKLLKHWEENQDNFTPAEWGILLDARKAGYKNFYETFDKCKTQYSINYGKKIFIDILKMYIEDMKQAEKMQQKMFDDALDAIDEAMNDNYTNRKTKAS